MHQKAQMWTRTQKETNKKPVEGWKQGGGFVKYIICAGPAKIHVAGFQNKSQAGVPSIRPKQKRLSEPSHQRFCGLQVSGFRPCYSLAATPNVSCYQHATADRNRRTRVTGRTGRKSRPELSENEKQLVAGVNEQMCCGAAEEQDRFMASSLMR